MDFYGQFSKMYRKTPLDFRSAHRLGDFCSVVEEVSGAAMRFWGDFCMDFPADFDPFPQENDDLSTIIRTQTVKMPMDIPL